MSKKIIPTEEQKQFILDNYRIKYNIKEMCEILSIKKKPLTRIIKKLGLKTYIGDPFYFKEDYFKDLNIETANLAGKIATDGCVSVNGNSYKFQYLLAKKDECILDDFIQKIGFQGNKTYAKCHNFNTISHIVNLRLANFKTNYEYLNKYYNITPRKTLTLQPPNLSDKYLQLSFLVGVIDGDGCITMRRNKKYKESFPALYVCGASYPFIEWIKKIIDENFPCEQTIRKRECKIQIDKPNNVGKILTYRFCISSIRAAIAIDFLRQIPVFKLPRKWDQPEILSYIESKKSEFPHLFQKLDLAEIQHLLPPKFPNTPVLV